LAGALGIGLTILLAAKQRLEAFPHALSRAELEATLTLAVVAAVIFPILPDRGYGPWEVWNPRELWGMVVLVCGLSSLRSWRCVLGTEAGSRCRAHSAVSCSAPPPPSRSRSARAKRRQPAPRSGGGRSRTLVMLVRVAVLTRRAGAALLGWLARFGAAALGVRWRSCHHRTRGPGDRGAMPTVTNPFALRGALTFAAIYALVLLVVEGASRLFGTWGVLAAAVLTGLTDVDAITLSLATPARAAREPVIAMIGIAVAALSNTAAKAVYAAWLGSAGFRRALLWVLGSAFGAGLRAGDRPDAARWLGATP
jgi:uncharacterized membrane protein (DUF4010 family)